MAAQSDRLLGVFLNYKKLRARWASCDIRERANVTICTLLGVTFHGSRLTVDIRLS